MCVFRQLFKYLIIKSGDIIFFKGPFMKQCFYELNRIDRWVLKQSQPVVNGACSFMIFIVCLNIHTTFRQNIGSIIYMNFHDQ